MNDQLLALLQPCALVPEEAPTPPPPEAPFVLHTRRGQPVRLEARDPILSSDVPQPSGLVTLHLAEPGQLQGVMDAGGWLIRNYPYLEGIVVRDAEGKLLGVLPRRRLLPRRRMRGALRGISRAAEAALPGLPDVGLVLYKCPDCDHTDIVAQGTPPPCPVHHKPLQVVS